MQYYYTANIYWLTWTNILARKCIKNSASEANQNKSYSNVLLYYVLDTVKVPDYLTCFE